MPTPLPGLAKRWMHSFEEDHGDVAVYRPSDYAFPPARGRDGIEFSDDGSFTEWAVGRGDAREPVPGRWETAAGDTVAVSTDRGGQQVLEVVHLGPDRLEVRRRADD
ncbi:hypothetical protein FHU33_1113 [Blastococcus colisei]|uniref:Uncharacterized protein n=1 Tax=Blastococcus colisei TaxID=1564162 RepID=A0A543PCC8_9ACTN|nr:hypothetical protein [Blastococcus colisei]TQN41735.1 hypothetical protein FHU33_1113 [Blastococcus colisei]